MNKTILASITTLALSQAVFASDVGGVETDHEGTYWGMGLGTVFGALVGGPPGAVAGAAMGGSIGWGQDKGNALDNSDMQLDKSMLALSEAENEIVRLERQSQKMQRINALQLAELSKLAALTKKDREQKEILDSIAKHYSQEVYYRHNESSIPNYAKARIDKLAAFMHENIDLNIELKGHTDRLGPENANMALSKSRVDAISGYLIGKGIAPQRIQTEVLGESQASVFEGDALNYVLDRRVAIELSVPSLDPQSVAASIEGF
jgi:outer membrane protein OmpA-like peptidoglycan-associated protein